jgi:nucleotide-binding universal stress UspA family protein
VPNDRQAEQSREPEASRQACGHEHETVKLKRDPFLVRLRSGEGEALVYTSLLHATDVTMASRPAFSHALALALATRGMLSIVHVAAGVAARAGELPGIRSTLIRWGHLAPGATRRDVGGLGIEVHKFRYAKRNPIEGLVEALDAQHPDLLVIATRRGAGVGAIRSTSVARPVARESGCPTLFFPHGVPGFVDEETGQAQLRRILVAVNDPTTARAVSLAAERLVRTLREEGATFRTLYLENGTKSPDAEPPADASGWSWEHVRKPQSRGAKHIVSEAVAWKADLIVLARSSRRRLLDVFRSRSLDRVLDGAPCPVLAIQPDSRRR